ncbi:ciliary microtubule-associated protein 2-like [Danaus plexippus]|uniref:ciliary microtubule-associated protein 2-like n=1 Tax=Danaus plexippus TaxID=13037 RepID=UPI002AB1BB16|nr:ciliary microtubule-associated protein 2-like [Danaus plexippus]
MAKPKEAVPFGSKVQRFGKITVHPNLDPSGLYTIRADGCDPCLYHPQDINEIFKINRKRKTEKDPWRYKKELEEWARNLGYRNQKVLERRKWFNSILGPAWHDVPERKKYEPACKNLSFGRKARFGSSKNYLPGPGTYYKTVPFKAPYGPHSSRPTFEREEACRFKDTSLKWSLAPDRYKILDKQSIENKSKKIVSIRGPYDLFTGKRDGSTIKNHFSASQKCSAATWPIALKGTLDKYEKSHFGVMNKTNRSLSYRGRNALVDISMCLKKPTDPGPAHYNTDKPKTFKQNKCGFNSSYDKPPGYKRVIVWPAVGRYRAQSISCGILGQGHRHVFLSKQERTIGAIIPEPMNSF